MNDNKSFAEHVIECNKWGILNLHDGEYPYGVPVNYVYLDGKIYIHGSSRDDSKKIRLIKSDNRICFTIISKNVFDAEDYTTHYESVIIYGTARIVTKDELMPLMTQFMHKLSPMNVKLVSPHCTGQLAIIEITPNDITYKAGN